MLRRTSVSYWIISSLFVFAFFTFVSFNYHSKENNSSNGNTIEKLVQQYEESIISDSGVSVTQSDDKQPKIWVSMGLCFSENTEKYGKKFYPYAKVTQLSILLWNYFYPDESKVGVILYLIHNEVNKTDHMIAYEEMLKTTGANFEWVYADGMDCVLKSQLVRLFSYGHKLVHPSDIVVTVDVNFFPLNERLFDPILKKPDKLAWIYQYDKSLGTSPEGETFNQNLIALPARIWKRILSGPSVLSNDWLNQKVETFQLDQSNTWFYDQWITTLSLLQNQICSVPQENGLWNHKGVHFHPDFDDSGTCWHGHRYSDCNSIDHVRPGGCKWYHFHPEENFDAHLKKFNEITKNSYKLDLMSIA